MGYYIMTFLTLGLFIYVFVDSFPEIKIDTPQTPESVFVRVVRVIDGDTIKIIEKDTEHNVRLIGIDAPEMSDCGGTQSRSILENLLKGKEILLEADPTQGNTDKYDRLLRYVFTNDNININEQMIKRGEAREYTYDKPYKYVDLFISAENTAKDENLGIWSDRCEN